ncbi:AMP-binding protein [Vibrio viridaestus]|uniref:AMP-dependent synthetase/ligase domain-containing protein n=1 Tax=Vibrio viridaestus TaxID=2487322 RepID=A0A3N9TLK3_9VIBR|nr:AMP-binding protein [Vibrio viridaestus]RQW64874.1 hypothetical protein EES38_02215 [Vibrio viridaestus]
MDDRKANSVTLANYPISHSVHQFIQHINMQGEAISDYSQLLQWSISHSQRFWQEVWQYCDVIGYRGECVLGEKVPSERSFDPLLDSIWFPDAQLNYAENLLSFAYQEPERVAIYYYSESGDAKTMTWQELSDKVSIIQQWLQQNHIGKSDVVASMLPVGIENIIAFLAVSSLGAVYSSIAPECIDSTATPTLLKQLRPKAMFCANGYIDDGKIVDLSRLNQHICSALSSLNIVCQVEHIRYDEESNDFNDDFSDWEAVLASYIPRSLKYERVWFNAPLYLCCDEEQIIREHSVGTVILNHLKDQQLQLGITEKTVCYSSFKMSDPRTLWSLTMLASGASLVLYEGNPAFPSTERFFKSLQESSTNFLFIESTLVNKLTGAVGSIATFESVLPEISTALLPESDWDAANQDKLRSVFGHQVKLIGGAFNNSDCETLYFVQYADHANERFTALGYQLDKSQPFKSLNIYPHSSKLLKPSMHED